MGVRRHQKKVDLSKAKRLYISKNKTYEVLEVGDKHYLYYPIILNSIDNIKTRKWESGAVCFSLLIEADLNKEGTQITNLHIQPNETYKGYIVGVLNEHGRYESDSIAETNIRKLEEKYRELGWADTKEDWYLPILDEAFLVEKSRQTDKNLREMIDDEYGFDFILPIFDYGDETALYMLASTNIFGDVVFMFQRFSTCFSHYDTVKWSRLLRVYLIDGEVTATNDYEFVNTGRLVYEAEPCDFKHKLEDIKKNYQLKAEESQDTELMFGLSDNFKADLQKIVGARVNEVILRKDNKDNIVVAEAFQGERSFYNIDYRMQTHEIVSNKLSGTSISAFSSTLTFLGNQNRFNNGVEKALSGRYVNLTDTKTIPLLRRSFNLKEMFYIDGLQDNTDIDIVELTNMFSSGKKYMNEIYLRADQYIQQLDNMQAGKRLFTPVLSIDSLVEYKQQIYEALKRYRKAQQVAELQGKRAGTDLQIIVTDSKNLEEAFCELYVTLSIYIHPDVMKIGMSEVGVYGSSSVEICYLLEKHGNGKVEALARLAGLYSRFDELLGAGTTTDITEPVELDTFLHELRERLKEPWGLE